MATAQVLFRVSLLVVILAVSQRETDAAVLRGVDPSKAQLYANKEGTFACLDGSKVVPYARVNDNYCDCADGSDEPGTPACYRGRFYCANLGHEPKLLASSFVDDGICDCCDGSDELSGCAYTCLEKSAAKKVALHGEVDTFKANLAKKAGYVAGAKSKRVEWTARLAAVGTEIAAHQANIPLLQAEVARLEAEKVVREQTAAAVTATVTAAAAAAAAAAAGALPADDLGDTPAGGTAGGTGAHAHGSDDPAVLAASLDAALNSGNRKNAAEEQGEGEETDEERGRRIASQWTHDPDAALPEEEETDEERGRRIASQWTHDPDAALPETASAGLSAEEGETYVRRAYEPQHHARAGVGKTFLFEEGGRVAQLRRHWQAFVASSVAGWDSPWAGWVQGLLNGSTITAWVSSSPRSRALGGHRRRGGGPVLPTDHFTPPAAAADPDSGTALGYARINAGTAVDALAALLTERANLERWTQPGVDFGPDDVWLTLAGRCFTEWSTRFSYEACFFDRATQKEGVNVAGLGAWAGFEADHTQAVFAGGDPCAGDAPQRSLRLYLHCGAEETVWESSEPSTCVYIAHFQSPAACGEARLLALQQELDDLEHMERHVMAQIAEAAQQRAAASSDDVTHSSQHTEL